MWVLILIGSTLSNLQFVAELQITHIKSCLLCMEVVVGFADLELAAASKNNMVSNACTLYMVIIHHW